MHQPSGRAGIRLIALFEAAKALLILLTGFGLLALIHHDVEAVAASVVRHLHINPANRYPRIFIKACENLTDFHLIALAMLALTDAILRGFVAVGLWHNRLWGKWLGVATAAIYIPFEVYELTVKLTWFRWAAVIINVAIVLYLAQSIRRERNTA